MRTRSGISTGVVAKNSARSFIGQAVPLVVALVLIPRIVQMLEIERFGALSLIWITLGHFTVFDFGLARATSKLVAEAVGRGELESISAIVWTSLALQLLFGLAGGAIVIAVTPFVVDHFLKLSPQLVLEVRSAFLLLGIATPICIISFCLRGVLEASQRFDLTNLVRIPTTSLAFVLPAVGAYWGLRLPGIVVLLTASIFGAAVAYFGLCLAVFPVLWTVRRPESAMMRMLVTFGGWVTLCNLLVPVLIYLDRWLISSLVSVEALGYYTAASEVACRLQVFPQSLGAALYPAFSTNIALGAEAVAKLYMRSITYLVLLMGPIVVVLVLFAREILSLWLGGDIAAHSGLVFQILVVGMLMNAVSQVPASFLDATGRPDLRAKLLGTYVTPYAGGAVLLTWWGGIVGAGGAWSARAFVELSLFLAVSSRLLRIGPDDFVENGAKRVLAALGSLSVVMVLGRAVADEDTWVLVAFTIICLALFTMGAWRFVIDASDRNELRAVFQLMFAGKRSP